MTLISTLSIIISSIAFFFSIYTFVINRKLTEKQQFVSVFFNMIDSFQEIKNNLNVDEVKGKDVFKYLYARIITGDLEREINERNLLDLDLWESDYGFNPFSNFSVNYYTESNLAKKYNIKNTRFPINLMNTFEPYYIHFQNILAYVDSSTFLDNNKKSVDERAKFIDIFKITLSPFELVFIFYYYLTADNFKETDSIFYNFPSTDKNKDIQSTKLLIEKYSIFENLSHNFLINSTFDNLTNEKLNDSFKNDYERFVSDEKYNKRKYYKSAFEKDLSLFRNNN